MEATSAQCSDRFLQQLKQIHRTAVEIKEKVASHLGNTLDTPSSCSRNRPSYHLPEVAGIIYQLVDAGASLNLAKSISSAYERHANELRYRTDDFIRKLCEDPALLSSVSDQEYDRLLRRLVDGRITIYNEQLRTWTDAAVSQVQTRVAASSAPTEQKMNKKAFNYVHITIPYLHVTPD